MEPIIQSELSHKETNTVYLHVYIYIYGIQKDGIEDPKCKAAKETQA